jgi:pimeloyl-ACP methyl ester carboxylesterase
MIRGWFVIAWLAATLMSVPANAASPGPIGEPSGPWREQIHWVPTTGTLGFTQLLYTRICRPPGDKRARVVLLNHGLPPDISIRQAMQPTKCDSEAAQWFLTRGYLVVAGMRRGYGDTGGIWAESKGPSCSADGYAHAGKEGAHDIDALLNYATALPYARPDGVVVVGHSAGGWATNAYNSLPHSKVVAMVSMAGGHGGHDHNTPNLICRPEELERAAGIFGATATTPMLWIYAANDSSFAPDVAAAMHAAFTKAGGKAELIQTGPFDDDGHRLFFGRGGSAIWGPMMERYLASRGAAP